LDNPEFAKCGLCLDTNQGMYGDDKGPIVDVCKKGWVRKSSDCVKSKEREICSKVKNCAMMTGEASICGWSSKLNKAIVRGSNNNPKYNEDKEAGNLVDINGCGKIFKSSSCSATWNGTGHSNQCLQDVWNWVGCSSSTAPKNNYDGLWKNQPIYNVINDMTTYKRNADSTDYTLKSKYYKKCYGRDPPDMCSDVYTNKPVKCYQDTFTKSGCLKEGSMYPTKTVNMNVSDYKKQIGSIIQKSHDTKLSYDTRNVFYKGCYGSELPEPQNGGVDVQPGLNAYVYRNINSSGVMGDLLTKQPIRIYDLNKWWGTGKVLNVDYDNVYVSIEGYITYPDNASMVQYRLGSDDGSRLFINGKEDIDNWGLHGFRWKYSNNLRPINNRTDEIKIEMYETGGAANLVLQWRINGGGEENWRSIPTQYLNSSIIRKNNA
jgi:hypothetical protein